MISSRADPAGVARVLSALKASAVAAPAPAAPRLAVVRRPDPPSRSTATAAIGLADAGPILPAPEVAAILDEIAKDMSLRVAAILDRKRSHKLVRARAAAAFAARRTTTHSLATIGSALGGRDHSMVHYLIHKAEGLRDTDQDFRELTDGLLAEFGEAQS